MRRLAGWGARVWDAVTAWDPGLLRLGQGLFTALSMSGALAIVFALSQLARLPVSATVAAMLLGTMIAMMGIGALVGPDAWPKVRTALLFPPVTAAGMVAGVVAEARTVLVLVGFVVVMFAAVWVRRFGPAWFSCGFMGWMGYFFASRLHADWAALPLMIAAVVIGAAWALLLSARWDRRPAGACSRASCGRSGRAAGAWRARARSC